MWTIKLNSSQIDELGNWCLKIKWGCQLIFTFLLFLGMVMYANEFKTKEKQKLREIKN